jgi:hypothetical protein
MHPVRVGVVAGLCAISLWGLFSLLDSLSEPGLLRTDKAAVVKGCESLDSQKARDQCPAFFCQKALIDAKIMPLTGRFQLTLDETYEDDERLIEGRVTDGQQTIDVACELKGMKVIDAAEIEAGDGAD